MKTPCRTFLALAAAAVFVLAGSASAGINDRFSKVELTDGDYIKMPVLSSAPDAPTATDIAYLYVTGDVAYFVSDGQAATSMISASTAWSDIGDPTADSTITFADNEITKLSFADTNEDMFTVEFIGAFGDVSGMVLEQKTGDPTNGTMLEVKVADENVDGIVVNNTTAVLGVDNTLYTGIFTDDGDANGIFLNFLDATNASKFKVEADGKTTIAGVADGTDAFTITAGDFTLTDGDFTIGGADDSLTGTTASIDFTDFDLSGDGLIVTTPDAGTGTGIDIAPSNALDIGVDLSDANIVAALDLGANTIISTGGTFAVDGAGNITANDVTAAGTISGVTILQDAISAKTADTTLTLDGKGTGGVGIGTVAGDGQITLGGSATAVVLPATVDLTLSGGDVSVTDTVDSDLVTLVNDTATTADIMDISAGGTRTSGNVLKIADSSTTADTISIVADTQTSGDGIFYSNDGVGLTGSVIHMDVTDGGGFTGYYLRAYDGGADDFSIKRYGATIIGGLADTNMLTVTTGHLQVDDGMIEVDTNEDHSSNVTRAFAGVGTGPAFAVVDSDAATTNSALSVTSGGTASTGATITTTGVGNATGLAMVHSGDLPIIALSAGAARDGDAITLPMANMLDERALYVSGAITGTAGEGVIEIHATGVIPATASLLRLDADTAQPGNGSGYCLNVDDDSLVVAAPSHYAVLIDSNANEALHVATGTALFDELATFTLGVDSNAAIDADFADNTGFITVDALATDYVAGTGVITVYDDSAGQTNASYLLRLAREGSADAQNHFILCQDDSTGVAADGTDVFTVDYAGAVTAAGDINANGNIVGDGATEMAGVIADVIDAGATNPYEVTAAMSGTIFMNSQAVEFDLPADPTGSCWGFVVGNASNLHIDPNVNDVFSYIGCAAGDRLLSATVGDTIWVCGTSATSLVVKSVTAGDGDFTDTVWTDGN